VAGFDDPNDPLIIVYAVDDSIVPLADLIAVSAR